MNCFVMVAIAAQCTHFKNIQKKIVEKLEKIGKNMDFSQVIFNYHCALGVLLDLRQDIYLRRICLP